MKNLFLIICFLLSGNVKAQNTWEKYFRDFQSPSSTSFENCHNGDIAMTGYYYEDTLLHSNFVRVDTGGTIVSQQQLSHPILVVREDDKGEFWAGGYQYLYKLSKEGKPLNTWKFPYQYTYLFGIHPQTKGEAVVAFTEGYPVKLYLAKVTANGSIGWAKQFTDTALMSFTSMASLKDGGFIIFGKPYWTPNLSVLRFDANGKLLWNKDYYAQRDYTYSGPTLFEASNGDLLISNGNYLRLSPTGEVMWALGSFIGSLTSAYDTYIDADGNYVSTGVQDYPEKGISLVKFKDNGKVLFSHLFGFGKQSYNLHFQSAKVFPAPRGGSFLAANLSGAIPSKTSSGSYLLRTDKEGYTGCEIYTPPITEEMRQLPCTALPDSLHEESYVFSLSPVQDPGLTSNAIKAENFCCINTVGIESNLYDYPLARNDSVILKGIGGPHFRWSTGDTSNSIRFKLTRDTTIYLIGNNTCGRDTDTLQLSYCHFKFSYTVDKKNLCWGDSALIYVRGFAPAYNVTGENVRRIDSNFFSVKPTQTGQYCVSGGTNYERGPNCADSVCFTITVNPNKPFITRKGDSLVSSVPGNIWLKDGAVFNGNRSIKPFGTGAYQVAISNSEGCTAYSDMYYWQDTVKASELPAWQLSFKHCENGQLYSMTIDTAENIYTTGTDLCYSANGNYYFINKVSREGNLLWTRNLPVSYIQGSSNICWLKTNHALLAFSRYSTLIGNIDVILIKFGPEGNIVAQKAFGDYNNQQLEKVVATADGGFLAAGYTDNPKAVNKDAFLARFDANLNLIWSKRLDDGGDNYLDDVVATENNAFFVTLSSRVLDNITLLKINATGQIEWAKVPDKDRLGYSLLSASDNKLWMIGYHYPNSTLAQLDENGNVLKAFTIGNGDSYRLTADKSELYLVGGDWFRNCQFIKLNDEGKVLWANELHKNEWSEFFHAPFKLKDGSLLTGGSSDVFIREKAVLLKLDSLGRIPCSDPFPFIISKVAFTVASCTMNSYNFGQVVTSNQESPFGEQNIKPECPVPEAIPAIVPHQSSCSNYRFYFTLERAAVKWVFEGGTPAMSYEQSPWVSYDSAGKYFVKIFYGESNYTDSLIQVIDVNPGQRVQMPKFPPVCIGTSPFNLSGDPPGGQYSGNGVNSNRFEPFKAGVGEHLITYTYKQNGCEKSAHTVISVKDCAGILSLDTEGDFNLYPNPAAESFLVSSSGNGTLRVKVLDMMGLTLLQVRSDEPSVAVNVSAVPSGVYCVEMTKGEKRAIKKVVLKR